MSDGCCGKAKRMISGSMGLAKAALKLKQAHRYQIEYRRHICRTCDMGVPCKNSHRICKCSECGCWLKAKTSIASEQCPLGKWHSVCPDRE